MTDVAALFWMAGSSSAALPPRAASASSLALPSPDFGASHD